MADANTVGPERPKPEAAAPDALRDMLARLNRDVATVAAKDSDLSRAIGQLAEVSNRPGHAEDPTLRTKAAYALQDYEKLAGPITTMPPALREEMTRLAATAPGLQNERLQELVRQTPGLSDRQLIADIRGLALKTGFQGGDQNRPEVRERVEALENRARLSPDISTAASKSARYDQTETSRAAATNERPPKPPRRPGPEATTDRPVPPSGFQTQRSPGQDETGTRPNPQWESAPGPSNGAARSAQAQEMPQQAPAARGIGGLSLALGALAQRWAAYATDENQGRPPSPIAERSARHEQQFQGQRDDAVISTAEKSQAAALKTVRDFAEGPASNILTKIKDAAKNEPGGMAAVLSEMREGGRFAGLRTQLTADLATERGAAAAYDRMTGALAQYGTDRAAVDAIGAWTNTAASMAAKFEKVDAEIGKALSILPSKDDGKSVMDDLGDKLRQIFERAADAVRSAFRPGAGATASPSPSP